MADQCKEMVHKADGTFHGQTYQCNRKAKQDGYCSQHHPDSVIARRDKNMAKRKAEQAARKRHYERPGLLREALEEIAKGQISDPAEYAARRLQEIYSDD